jgi:hypothetical protein
LNWKGLAEWQQWTLGIGCSLAAALIAWLSGRLFWQKREAGKRTIADVQQNASPVMTQNYQPSFQPTINIQAPTPAAPPTAPQVARAAPPISAQARVPNLTYAGWGETRVFISPDPRRGVSEPRTDHEGEQALDRALFLKFENALIPGQSIGSAMNVIAKLRFVASNRVFERAVDYGIWLASPCGSTTIDPGDTRKLLIKCIDGHAFVTFEDRRAQGHFATGSQYLDSMPVDGLELVEVTLVDKITQTVAKFQFRIRWDRGHCVSQL